MCNRRVQIMHVGVVGGSGGGETGHLLPTWAGSESLGSARISAIDSTDR